jgi:hypothetical protein
MAWAGPSNVARLSATATARPGDGRPGPPRDDHVSAAHQAFRHAADIHGRGSEGTAEQGRRGRRGHGMVGGLGKRGMSEQCTTETSLDHIRKMDDPGSALTACGSGATGSRLPWPCSSAGTGGLAPHPEQLRGVRRGVRDTVPGPAALPTSRAAVRVLRLITSPPILPRLSQQSLGTTSPSSRG